MFGALLAVSALTFASETEAVSLDERIRAQAAIQRVYHAHQLGETRPFELAVPRALLEKKVLRYLAASARFPLSAEQLRSEVERMQRETRLPDRLEELFAALGHDPLLIEECLARPLLLARIEAAGSLAGDQEPSPSSSVPLGSCVPDSWTTTPAEGAPSPRSNHTAVWTGNLMLVWGGRNGSGPFGDGARYDPALDSWSPISSAGAPEARARHTAVWTGTQMIVWGGLGGSGALANGGRYDPSSDSWTPTASQNAPAARGRATAVWTGSEMIVWGGFDESVASCNDRSRRDGGRYDPASDTWSLMALAPSPGRQLHTAVWSGSEMIVFGGYFPLDLGHGFCGTTDVTQGLAYDPLTDAWRSIASLGEAGRRASHVAVWTGSEMIVWGGGDGGGRYVPSSDSWFSMTPVGAPLIGQGAAADWTGSSLIVWGVGSSGASGGLYDPVANSWSPTTATGAPTSRQYQTGVWDGSGFVVWGGTSASQSFFDDGARYEPGNPDNDVDGICLDADNCPGVANASQADQDADGPGDACDNCPSASNPDQQNTDLDSAGDACDPCPFDFQNDADGDGACGDTDNCAEFNPVQRNADGDARGDTCDNCPTVFDNSFNDSDNDGQGNVCDCQPLDDGDRAPADAASLRVDRIGSVARLSWTAVTGADSYTITRADLALLSVGQYGNCLANGIAGTTFDDPTVPAAGNGFSYLVQGQNVECGLGSLGTDSAEQPRTNTDPGACDGVTVTDVRAAGESTVFGTVTGTLADASASDNVVQSLTEVLSSGGNPANRFSQLEQRWTFVIPAGSRVELHVDAFVPLVPGGEGFGFEYSQNGNNFTPVSLPALPSANASFDLVVGLPSSLSGSVTIRVVDLDRTQGEQTLDTIHVDDVWIRVFP